MLPFYLRKELHLRSEELCYNEREHFLKPEEETMNDFTEKIIARRSVKRFKQDPIPEEILKDILKAGTYAPTGRNAQSPLILAVTNKALRDRLSSLNAKIMQREGIDPFYGAPVVVTVLADRNVSTYLYDGSVVMENMMLSASSYGIGSCWIHRAKEMFETEEGKKILEELGIRGNYEGIGNCVLGYADGDFKFAPNPKKENYIRYIR